jgi:hypothetical protein
LCPCQINSLNTFQALLAGLFNSAVRPELLSQATGIAGTTVALSCLLDLESVPQSLQEHFHQEAKLVVSTSTTLIGHAKNIASGSADPSLQNAIINAAKTTALAASQLVTCTKVLATVIDKDICRDQLLDTVRIMASAVADLVSCCQRASTTAANLRAFGEDANKVSRELTALTNDLQLENATSAADEDDFEVINQASDSLQGAVGNPTEMLRQAKALVMASSKLLQSVKDRSDAISDRGKQKEAEQSIRSFTHALNISVEFAKGLARNPGDATAQVSLASSIPELRAAVLACSSGTAHKKLIRHTIEAVRQVCSTVTQLQATLHASSATNLNAESQKQLTDHGKAVGETITLLLAAIKRCIANRDSPASQLELVATVKVSCIFCYHS